MSKMTKSKNLAQLAPGEGSTKSSPNDIKKSESRPAGACKWTFTWHNYSENWMAQMALGLDGCLWCAGEEFTQEGTPHLQGYVEFPTKVRPIGYKGFPKEIHWGDKFGKPAKGNRAQNIKYCSKEGRAFHGNLKKIREMTFPDMDKWWQKEVLEYIKNDPDDRTINWYYGPGGIGKTTFTKYLIEKHNAVMVAGKGADVRNAICTYLKDTGNFPELVVFPIPKSFNSEYLSYEALENIKDMCFYSGKYEGGQVCGPCPHLFVFSNEPPEYRKLSTDRWRIVNIEEEPAKRNWLRDLPE